MFNNKVKELEERIHKLEEQLNEPKNQTGLDTSQMEPVFRVDIDRNSYEYRDVKKQMDDRFSVLDNLKYMLKEKDKVAPHRNYRIPEGMIETAIKEIEILKEENRKLRIQNLNCDLNDEF